MTSSGDADRRSHVRDPQGSVAEIDFGGVTTSSGRIVDISPTGALVELPHGTLPPALGAEGVVRSASIQARARVVRVRFVGRERGQQLPPAIALSFI